MDVTLSADLTKQSSDELINKLWGTSSRTVSARNAGSMRSGESAGRWM